MQIVKPLKVFLDLDGVLVDFDGHYEKLVGPLPDRNDPKRDVRWKDIAGFDFFGTAPPMKDAFQLYEFVKKYNPVILTGVPTIGTAKAEAAKRGWVEKYFPGTPVITCRSKEKSLHMNRGDVLVDDWDKYRPMWTDKGGIWVLHKNAAQSIAELKGYGL